MKILTVSVLLMFLSFRLYAGGVIGGGPPAKGALQQPLLDLAMIASIPDLNLPKTEISIDEYRRVRMRLSASEVAPLMIEDKTIDLKLTEGAVTTLDVDTQVVPRMPSLTTAEK